MITLSSFRLIAAAQLSLTVALTGCAQIGSPQQTLLPQGSSAVSKLNICNGGALPLTKPSAAISNRLSLRSRPLQKPKHPRAILYVLVENPIGEGSVVLYDAYAKNPKVIRTVSNLGTNPSSLWTDGSGNVYVGISGQNAYDSFVSVYAPKMRGKALRTYTDGIGLPFGGTVDAKGRVYVSDGGLPGKTEGDIAIFPPGKLKPSQFKYSDVYVPHGIAVDDKRDIFVAEIYGSATFVVEFPHNANQGTTLPLNDLQGAFLEGLVLDASRDIVVADECNQAVRFYPPPYKDESTALTSGIVTPDSVAYAPDGSLFVGNQFIVNEGNVVVFAPGSSTPARTISSGITGQVLGVAVGGY
jgi:hypothetical protein